MELGERIDAWCEFTGKTYQDLADAAEVTIAAVYQWVGTEKRKTKGKKPKKPGQRTDPSQAHLEKVVAEFGITMVEFYGEIPKPKKARAS